MVEKLALDPFMKSQIHLFFKHQANKWLYFSEQGWGKFQFGKNFLRRESPTLKQRKNQVVLVIVTCFVTCRVLKLTRGEYLPDLLHWLVLHFIVNKILDL